MASEIAKDISTGLGGAAQAVDSAYVAVKHFPWTDIIATYWPLVALIFAIGFMVEIVEMWDHSRSKKKRR